MYTSSVTARRIATSVVGSSSRLLKYHFAGSSVPSGLAVLEQADVPRHHLLLRVVGHAQRIVPDCEMADGQLLTGLHQRLFFLLEALAGESEEHEHDADVHDVAAVAALRTADEADERGHDVGTGRLTPHLGAADELLDDCPEHHGRQARSTGRSSRRARPRA